MGKGVLMSRGGSAFLVVAGGRFIGWWLPVAAERVHLAAELRYSLVDFIDDARGGCLTGGEVQDEDQHRDRPGRIKALPLPLLVALEKRDRP